jgi:hypothetical protein
MTAQTHKRLPSEPTQEMIEAMELAASRMVNAQVACMDGLGGSKTYDELDDETKQYVGRDYPATVGMYRAMWEAAPEVNDQTALINQLTDELNKTEAERVRWMTMALTSQPKQSELERAPLACESIESLFNESSCDISLGYFEEIVRMVEQEHGIGD